MNDTKMDIQRSGETIERTAVKYSAKATKGLAKLTKMLTLYGIKMFANPLNAIKKDGPNKTLIHTPELTKEEAKVMIAKLREAEILETLLSQNHHSIIKTKKYSFYIPHLL